MKIAIVFIGALNDGGFNACALEGAERACDLPDATIEILSGIPFQPEAMTEALAAAARRSEGLIFVGGQGNRVTPAVAAAFPDCAFAVVQGEVTGQNLASYDVLQEQSAFLAGCLAARMTRSGVVGHLSGHRVTPGLKGRAAFAAGVVHTDPEVRLLTGFCGTQDDSAITEAWAAEIARGGADIIFTMLNAARDGATAACRAAGMRQIGNVIDWCAVDSELYLASAIARIDRGVELAVADLLAGRHQKTVLRLGLAQDAVALACAPDVPAEHRSELAALAQRIVACEIAIPTTYEGPELALPA